MAFVSQTISISQEHFKHVNIIIIDHHKYFSLSSKKGDVIIHKFHIQNWGLRATKIYYTVIQKIYTQVSKPVVEEGTDHGSTLQL